jgi:hypothetical protein
MSNESFRRELGLVFDEMTGSHSASLADRVRSSLADPPPQRAPFWIAGVAAALIAVIAVGIVLFGNFPRDRMRSVGVPASSPSSIASPDSTPAPFQCSSSYMHFDYAQAPSPAVITGLWTGTQPGYDRLEIEWKGGPPWPTGPTSIDVTAQPGTTFTRGPSGQTVKLAGQNGVLVRIANADLHSGYTGSTDLKTGFTTLVEVRQVEDFEGMVQLALGVSGAPCYRAFTLYKTGGTSSLVIDVKSSA